MARRGKIEMECVSRHHFSREPSCLKRILTESVDSPLNERPMNGSRHNRTLQ
jgi:hypothetical protein